jgi:RES domain-containing protein
VYAAGSQSLALLEILAHLECAELLDRYVFFRVDFDAELVEEMDAATLGRNWRSYPAPSKNQAIGDDWAARGQKPVLRVPSAIVPAESNYLLNAAHAGFERLTISDRIPYRFDSRLV